MQVVDVDKHFGEHLPDIRTLGPMMFDPIWAEQQHAAGGCEMLHVIKGTVTLITDTERFVATPGDTLLVPQGTRHRDDFDLDEGLELFFCSFVWAMQDDYFAIVNNDTLVNLPALRKAEISTLFDQLRADLAGATPADKLVTRARILTILLLILREARARAQGDVEDVEGTPYGTERRRALMLQAKEYLLEHYAECVSLDDIASALRVSAYYLSHLFSEQSDFSLFSYLTNLRMDKARALLLEGKLNVSEVGRAVGYENANYFSKAFKKHVGCSPREFAASGYKKR